LTTFEGIKFEVKPIRCTYIPEKLRLKTSQRQSLKNFSGNGSKS